MRMRRSFTGVAIGLIVGLMAPNALAIQQRPDMARFNDIHWAVLHVSDAPTPITLWLRDGCYRIKALPNHTKAKGGTTPVCFRTSSNPEAGTTSVQWKP